MKKRVIAIILTLCMTLSLSPATASAEDLDGWPEETQDENMTKTSQEVTLEGISDGDRSSMLLDGMDIQDNFCDENEQDQAYPYLYSTLDTGFVTRGAWIAELVPLFGLTAEEYPDVYFPDVEGTAYYDAIMIATMCGMIDVEAGDNFEPDSPLTQGFAVQTLNYRLGLQPGTESADLNAQVAMECGWFDGAYAADAVVTEAQCTAMLDDARSILASRVTPNPVSNYQFANDVVVVPTTAEVSVQGGTVQITGFTEITQGTVFAFYDQGLAFVYTANYVDTQGDTLLITTAPAPEDAVISAEFAGEIVPELTFIPDENVVTLMDSDSQPVVFGAARAVDIGKDYIKISRSITLSDGVTGSLNVDVTHVKLTPRFELWGTKSFLLEGDLDVSSTVKFDLLNDPAAGRLSLGGIDLGPFGYVGLEISLQMEAKLTYTYRAEFGLGTEWRGGNFYDLSYCNAGASTLSADGKVSAKVSLAGYLDLGVIGSADARIGIGPVVKMSARRYSSGMPETCITLAAYLEAGASINADFLNIKKYSKSWDFYTEKNSPIRAYEHIEDGVTVYSCTCGGVEQTVKYITPAGSRYYTSGNRNGSSFGTGSGGQPVVIWETEENNDGTLTITKYQGNASVLNIPETIDGKKVTIISSSAFQNNKNIRVAVIPDSVTKIGNRAFQDCANLQTIDFSKNLRTLGGYAFYGCSSLTEVILPEGFEEFTYPGYSYGYTFGKCTSLEHIYIPTSLKDGTGANFSDCPNLTQITFGEGIMRIPSYLFSECTSITHMEIPDTVTEIGSEAFYKCTNLTLVTIPDYVTVIESSAFNSCSKLTAVDIPDSVTKIGNRAFQNCVNLQTIDFGENLRTLGGYAFYGCSSLTEVILPEGFEEFTYPGYSYGYTFGKYTSLEHVYIPASLKDGTGANFSDCPNLTQITFGEGIMRIPSYLFSECTSIIDMEIPDTVTEIGWNAFYKCTNLTSVTIPDYVTVIEREAFSSCTKLIAVDIPDSVTEINSYAFYGCTNLQTVDFSQNLLTLGGYAFYGCSSLTEVILPEGFEKFVYSGHTYGYTFGKCTSLEHVYIPASLKDGTGANFSDCPRLTQITFGEGIMRIPSYLFSECTSITHMEIPDTVTEIGWNAFYKCTNLTSVTIPDYVTVIEREAFSGCRKLIAVDIPDSVTAINNYAFYGCINLKSADLSVNLSKLEANTFQNCSSLERVDLSDSVTALGNYVFAGCSSLTAFTAGAGLTAIDNYCFQDCTKLASVDLNDGLIQIGSSVFQRAKALSTIVLPGSVTSIGSYAFQESGVSDVTLSPALTKIPAYAFANCASLVSIEIPKGVTTIDANAFYQDTKLTEITIPQTVTSIGTQAFSYPTKMTVRGCSGSYAEEWATTNRSTFVDITAGVTALSLANGTDRMTIGTGQTVTPMFTMTPANTTDIITLSSDNTNVVSISNSTALRGVRAGTANITATASSGVTYTFAVTVAAFTGIEIGHLPNIISYGLKDDMNLDGLVVYAVFANGSKEAVTAYTVKGFNTDSTGVKVVTVTYANKTATFNITVAKVETGIMTNPVNGKTVNWSYNDVAQTVTISGTIPEGEQICVARYGMGGHFLGMEIVRQSRSVDVSQSEEVQLIWVTIDTYAPICESKRFRDT